MWNTLRQIPKFTAKSELERSIGAPVCRLEDRPAYYHGGGFVVYYSPRQFRVEGIQRVEYGEPGEYAVGMYHFSTAEALKTELGLNSFAADDARPFEGDILEGVSYASTFREAQKRAAGCQTGETQRLVDGNMVVLHQFIQCEQFELYFWGTSGQAKLTGFRFAFDE